MTKKPNLNLWPKLIVSVFFIMLFSIFILLGITVLLEKLNIISSLITKHFIPIIILFILSVILSLFFTLMIGRIILKPINALITATKKVSNGDFSIRLNEEYKESTIRDMNIHFNKMTRELSGIETFRNDFIANVSHEFRTPITAIEGYATLLQDKNISEAEHDEYTRMIIDSSRQLSALSSNILKLSKLENQEIVLEKTTFRLDEQIRQAILLLEAKWSYKNLNLDIDLFPIKYYGNEELLIQVWLNILNNAIKFTGDNGSIHVTSKRTASSIIVEITDTGIGMTEETQKHIFEKFYQGDKNRKVEGNGLGLALAKKIVELCDGLISVNSELGNGSTFVVMLPNNET